MKKIFMKTVDLSKTATFATIANVMVLVAYGLSIFRGSHVWGFAIPQFDSSAAASVLAIVNGTYVLNHWNADK